MASIEKQPNGRWRARWRTPDGQTRSKTFRLKAQAEDQLTDVAHSKNTGAYVDPSAGRTTFAAWVKVWRPTVVDLRASTLARDDGYVGRYMLPTFGKLPLASIDHAAVQAWVADLTRRGLAPATVVVATQILGKIMAAAVASRRLASSPCAGVKLPRIEREEMRFLAPGEVATLADTIDRRYRALVYLGGYGGLRIGEMLGLRASRVDLLRGSVDVCENLVDVSGHLHFGPPKTRAGRRVVPLPRIAVDALHEHLTALEAGPGDLVFRAAEGGPVRLAGWRRRYWKPAVEAAGLAPLRPHDLRHSAVALWIAAGATPNEVAKRAGHTSVVTVLDRYGHLLPGSGDRVTAALDELAAAAAPVRVPGRLTQI
jgi:integrase